MKSYDTVLGTEKATHTYRVKWHAQGRTEKALASHLWLTLRFCKRRKGRIRTVVNCIRELNSCQHTHKAPWQKLEDLLIPGV